MKRYSLIWAFLLLVGFGLPAAEAARFPDPSQNGVEWFYVFGSEGSKYYGADSEPKEFFVEVPKSSGGPVMIRVLDADIVGKRDELAGSWDTSTRFTVYAGDKELDSHDVGQDRADGSIVEFGPYSLEQGEDSGENVVFRIQVQGLDGDDNNLFAFDIEPPQTQFYAYNPSIRLATQEGSVMRFYPSLPPGTSLLREQNYDLDPSGGIATMHPSSRALWKTFWVKNSGSGQWAVTDVPVRPEESGRRWMFRVTKGTQVKGNMTLKFDDQAGTPIPIYFSEGKWVRPIPPTPKPAPKPAPEYRKPIPGACNIFDFDASESYDPDNQQLTYSWDFGDGETSDQMRVQHAYAKPGTYKVVLVVTDSSEGECRQSGKEQWLRVNGPPVAVIDLPKKACVGVPVKMSAANSTDSTNDPLSYKWEFGDGETGEGAEVSHAYKQGGDYSVCLLVNDNRGTSCSADQAVAQIQTNTPPTAAAQSRVGEGLSVSFDASKSADADGDELTYLWDFGDGETGDGVRVTHLYPKGANYTAKLTVDDSSGTDCSRDTIELPIRLNRPPVAVLGSDIATCSTDPVVFDGSQSSDADGDALTYRWEFGDGETGEGVKTQHTYAKGGAYRVVLTVNDQKGMDDSAASAQMNVLINNAPTASIETDGKGCVGKPVAFSGERSSDPDGNGLQYRWDFGDGETAQGARAEHAYAKGGNYTVVLTVDDGLNTTCSVVMAKAQAVINTPPVANVGPNFVCCRGVSTSFDASKSFDADGDSLSYHWDFGDGETGEGAKVQHTYKENGTFQVKVTVSDGNPDCGTSSAGFSGVVNASPVAMMGIRGEGGKLIAPEDDSSFK